MRTPVSIFTGFLGVGKTTIIRNLLKQCPERKFAVVVNEFGAVSIDGSLIEQTGGIDIEVSNVTGGLIAYAQDEQFDAILEKIGQRANEFDHLIIETSGLAAPTAILERLHKGGQASRFILDSVIAVVDTMDMLNKSRRSGAMADVLIRQLEAADIVILNKHDGVNVQQLIHAETELRALSPQVRFVELAPEALVDRRVLLGMHLHATKKMAAQGFANTAGKDNSAHGHTHAGWGYHEHGLHTHEHLHEHDPGWLSFSLHCHQPQVKDKLAKAIDRIRASEPLFRAKGFFETTDKAVHELQCVRDRMEITKVESNDQQEHDHAYGHAHNLAENDGHGHDHDYDHQHHGNGSELVFIGYNLTRESVIEHLSAITKTEWH